MPKYKDMGFIHKTWLLLIFILISTAPAFAVVDCEPHLLEARKRILKFKETKWPETDPLIMTETSDGLKLDGIPITSLEITPGHTMGAQNSGIYFITRNGRHHIIKLLSPQSQESLYTLRSVLMAQEVGGATVHNYGWLILPKGIKRYYIEMDEWFHGIKSVTFKGLRSEQSPHHISTLDQKHLLRGNPTPLVQIAKMYVRAFENRLAPDYDADFIIANGEVRWIDTSEWKYYEEFTPFLTRGVNHFVTNLADAGVGLEIVQNFLSTLHTEINNSNVWTQEQKRKIIETVYTLKKIQGIIETPRLRPSYNED